MDFIVYDIAILFLFAILISIFLYTRKRGIKKEGLLLLYKTSWGIRLINRIGKKYKKTLKVLSYVSVALGFILMGTMLYLFLKILWVYLFNPEIVRAIKIPPIMPLIPYLPRIFNLDFLPPFYFIYWIIIIAIIAIPHELAHGIYSAYKNIKIKTTGFGFFPYFFPVFLAAFVEPDEKQMVKKDKFSQMTILSSGTFANVLTALFFFIILWIFFSLSFTPTGIGFDSYSYSIVNITGVSSILINNNVVNNLSYDNLLDSIENGGTLNEISLDGEKFLISEEVLENPQLKVLLEGGAMVLYDNAPAIKANLSGIITKIDGVKIESREILSYELLKNSPGDTILIETFDGEDYSSQNITLGENPYQEGVAMLGIGFLNRESGSIMGRIISSMSSFKKPGVYYAPNYAAGKFIYDLLWWIILISISVALVNMLPIGMFDGGRFFYLAVWGLTKNEKFAKKAFASLTYIFLFLVLLLMVFWASSFFI